MDARGAGSVPASKIDELRNLNSPSLFTHGHWRSFAVGRNCSCLALLLVVLTGCTYEVATTGERATSVSALAGRQVAAVPLDGFVQQRTAILIGGLGTDAVVEFDRNESALGDAARHGRFATGSATAIDQRGYFLTAGHCVEWGPLHVLLADRDRIRLVPARVVWRGTGTRHEPDLALLQVAEQLPSIFTWATDTRIGDPVIGAGPEQQPPVNYRLACFGGRILELGDDTGTPVPHTTILHSAPLRIGDSGGPLATVDGRLIGINVGDIQEFHVARLKHTRASRTLRPDPDWLRTIVENDSKRSAAP